MNENWAELDRLFKACCDLSPSEQRSFLDAHCATDLELRRELESLLRCDDAAYMESPSHLASVAQRAAATTALLAPGTQLLHYVIEDVLGHGGMGVVYLARDTHLDRLVALKLLSASIEADRQWRAQFEREARLLAALNHPNIATIHSFEEWQGRRVIAMERVGGESLAACLARGPLSIESTTRICRQVARGLEAAHERGIAHCDLKPANIHVLPEAGARVSDVAAVGQVKVLDFGLARALSNEALSATGVLAGTPGYMSPEQLHGLAPDARSDVFAFGCVLFECLSGAQAFVPQPGTSLAPPAWSALPATLSPRLRQLVERCLELEVSRRLNSIAEARAELDEEIAEQTLRALRRNEPATVTTRRAHLTNLPLPLTSFVGRAAALASVRAILGTHRLLTLTGAGGAGKTRLAHEVARLSLEEFNAGVWLVELATLADPELLPKAIAATLSIEEAPPRPIVDTIAQRFGHDQRLLVLDNCEHVLVATTAFCSQILGVASGLRILVTSREALSCSGEAVFHVAPLSVPAELPVDARDPSSIASSESVQLFVERARAIQHDFQLTTDNTRAVASICRELDGIPLAIELAAARVRVLAVAEIAERLSDRFRLLAGGPTSAPHRHQTLRALFDWSYEQLRGGERRLFRAIAIFSGGFTLEAAEAVCASDELAEWQVLDALASLAAKSLLEIDAHRSTDDARARYRLLETVRQYSLEQLATETAEHAQVRERHHQYYAELARRATAELDGPKQATSLTRLALEHGNLRVLFENSLTTNALYLDGLTLVGALSRYWTIRGHWAEGRRWCEQLLANTESQQHPAESALALEVSGILATRQSEYGAARRDLAKALLQFRATGDLAGSARILRRLGAVQQRQADFVGARESHTECLRIERARNAPQGIALALNSLGILAQLEGNYDQAFPLHQQSLAIFRELKDPHNIALSLVPLGTIAERREDFGMARQYYEEALELNRKLENRSWESSTLMNLGLVSERIGNYALALDQMQQSLRIRRELGDQHGIAVSLQILGSVANKIGQPECAVRLLAAAQVLREQLHAPLAPTIAARREQDVKSLRSRLGDEAYLRIEHAGRLLPLERAIEEGLALRSKAVADSGHSQSGDSENGEFGSSPRHEGTER
ncbi:MAG: protein kinase domain-containing protein [Planctomycetota bacterium]